jgi:hypothetical protein
MSTATMQFLQGGVKTVPLARQELKSCTMPRRAVPIRHHANRHAQTLELEKVGLRHTSCWACRNPRPTPALEGPPSLVPNWKAIVKGGVVIPSIRCKPCCVPRAVHRKLLLLAFFMLRLIRACLSCGCLVAHAAYHRVPGPLAAAL